MADTPPPVGYHTPIQRGRARRESGVGSPPMYGFNTPPRQDRQALQRLIQAEEGNGRPQRTKRVPVRLGDYVMDQ